MLADVLQTCMAGGILCWRAQNSVVTGTIQQPFWPVVMMILLKRSKLLVCAGEAGPGFPLA